jgi:DNA-binding SARP family transcriptional activator
VAASTSVAESIEGLGTIQEHSSIGGPARVETIRRLAIALDEQRRQLDLGSTRGVTVRCLGALQIQAGPLGLTHWRSGKARALFEYLVTHRGRVTPRDVLIETLWPDTEAVAPGTSLKVAIHALRQALSELDQADGGPLTIESHETGYMLVAQQLWLDVDEFEATCTLAGRLDTSGRVDEAVGLYDWACDLYRGDFLAESVNDWVVFRREALKDQYLFALARLADVALEAADYRACVHRCRQLLELDAYREDTYRTLIVCHARLGQPTRVRRWFELCVQTLRDDLDVAPEPETVRVYEQALKGRVANQVAN